MDAFCCHTFLKETLALQIAVQSEFVIGDFKFLFTPQPQTE